MDDDEYEKVKSKINQNTIFDSKKQELIKQLEF